MSLSSPFDALFTGSGSHRVGTCLSANKCPRVNW